MAISLQIVRRGSYEPKYFLYVYFPWDEIIVPLPPNIYPATFPTKGFDVDIKVNKDNDQQGTPHSSTLHVVPLDPKNHQQFSV